MWKITGTQFLLSILIRKDVVDHFVEFLDDPTKKSSNFASLFFAFAIFSLRFEKNAIFCFFESLRFVSLFFRKEKIRSVSLSLFDFGRNLYANYHPRDDLRLGWFSKSCKFGELS